MGFPLPRVLFWLLGDELKTNKVRRRERLLARKQGYSWRAEAWRASVGGQAMFFYFKSVTKAFKASLRN